MPKTGFEPRITGIRSNHTANWATVTAYFQKSLTYFLHKNESDSYNKKVI